MTTRVLGLDLSLVATGLACPHCGSELIKTKLRGMERLAEIEHQVMAHVEVGVERPDVVVIEGYSYGSKGSSIYNIGELGGVIRLALHKAGFPYAEVPPATLKKFTTGKGNVGKDEMIAAAIRKFGFEGFDNNAADAWMLKKMGELFYNSDHGKPQSTVQVEALAKVEWPTV